MKKILFVFAVAAFAACNGNAGSEVKPADTTAVAPAADTTAPAAPAADTTAHADTTAKAAK